MIYKFYGKNILSTNKHIFNLLVYIIDFLKTLQRKLNMVKVKLEKCALDHSNVFMVTTYFGRIFCVIVFKDSITGNILF